MYIIVLLYKVCRVIHREFHNRLDHLFTKIVFESNSVKCSSFRSSGIPDVRMNNKKNGMIVGKNLALNNGLIRNPLGATNRCLFYTSPQATIVIGDNVGMSQVSLVSTCSIAIGDNVKLGAGVRIYTSDFHSLNPNLRKDATEDRKHRKDAPVVIGNNAFIGAFSIILKGVTIGENSIVGAGAIVTKSVPDNQIWGGNPAHFIKEI